MYLFLMGCLLGMCVQFLGTMALDVYYYRKRLKGLEFRAQLERTYWFNHTGQDYDHV